MIRVELLNHKHVFAKIEITSTQGKIGVHQKGQLIYDFGFKNSPRYRIEMPVSPTDDPWKLEFLDENPLIPESQLSNLVLDENLKDLLGARLPQRSLELISNLPVGEYLICTFPENGVRTQSVQMGNITDDIGFEALVYGSSYHLSLSAFGTTKNHLPNTNQIFIGVTLLRFTGNNIENRGVWLFNFQEGKSASALASPCVVIPLSGELVLGFFSSLDYQQKEIYKEESELWKNEAIGEIEKSF